MNEHLLVGGTIAAMRQQTNDEQLDFALQHSQYLAEVTYFPTLGGTGPYLRGGLGLANVGVEVGNLSYNVNGIGGELGVGYAFWLGETFNLTAGADFHIARIIDSDVTLDYAWFVPIHVGFMWY